MSEEKQIEQQIGWYKVLFAVLSAIDISLFAWLVKNYKIKDPWLLVFCFLGIIVITLGIFLLT